MTRISDMTPLAVASPTGIYVPVERTGSTTNYRVDLAAMSTITPQMFHLSSDADYHNAFQGSLTYLTASALSGFGYGIGTASLFVPAQATEYDMGATTIDLDATTRIEGEGTGDSGGWASAQKWGANSHGYRIQYYGTSGDTAAGGTNPGAPASIISGLALDGAYSDGTSVLEGEYHGIFARARFSARDLNIWNWQGDGIRIHGDSNLPESGNANGWEVRKAFFQNVRNALSLSGNNANQGISYGLDIGSARQWGIIDIAGIQNLHIAPSAQLCGYSTNDGTAGKPVSVVANVAGTHRFAVKVGQEVAASTAAPPATAVDDANWLYYQDGGTDAFHPTWFSGINLRAGGPYYLIGSTLLHPYAEGGQPPCQFGGAVLRIGGTLGNRVIGGAHIYANSNQVVINDLLVNAGGIGFDDDQTGTLKVGRYSVSSPYSFVIPSAASTALVLRAPDNSNGIEVSNAAVAIDKPLAGTGAITSSGGGVGYATGAGAAVTQLTNKSTATPAINKVCGQVTMNNAALGAGAKVSFVVTNSTVAATDTIIVSVASGGTANAYRAAVTAISAGVSFTVTVENITAGSLSEAPVINFAILKSVAA